MEQEDKKKLIIEKLKEEKEDLKIQYSILNALSVGMLAILTAAYIPLMVAIKEKNLLISIAIFFVIISAIIMGIERITNRKKANRMNKLSYQINKIYDELLK